MTQTIRYSQLLTVFTLLLSLAWTSPSAQAQGLPAGKTRENQPSARKIADVLGDEESQIKLRIERVVMESAKARNNPNGAGRFVPFKLDWTVDLPASDNQLISSFLKLLIYNNTGARAEKQIELKASEIRGRSATIELPMAPNEFAKSYSVTLTIRCIGPNGKQISKSASLQGDFPEEKVPEKR